MYLFSQSEGGNYLADAEFRGYVYPGPDTYAPNASTIQKSFTSRVAMKVPNKGLSKSWRFEKTNKPDVGSYEHDQARMKVSTMRAAPKCQFSKMPNERFTTQYAKAHAFVPPPGEYDVMASTKALSRPPSASRRRR